MREVLWRAVNAAIGVEVEVSDTDAFKRRFYSERAKAREEGIFDFDSLQLITPPIDKTKWWIVHGQVQRKEEGSSSQEVPTII